MQFNYPAPQVQLDELQAILDANPEPGIVDIWACWNPFYIVAEDAHSAVGVASVNWGHDLCELHKLYIPPSSQRRGIGTALVEKVISILRENNVPELGIEIVDGSLPFWKKFAETHVMRPIDDNKFICYLT